jgi:orotate phosphoribosyltransferase-like protein
MGKFRFRKVTPEIKAKMIELRKKGYTFLEIADMFDVTLSTAQYHICEKQRLNTIKRATKYNRTLTKKEFIKRNKKRSGYKSSWFMDRYHNDEEFRKKVIRANNGGKFKE